MFRATTFGMCMFETGAARIEPDAEMNFALLLILAAATSDGVSREELVRLLWPNETRGRHCLRQALYRLRQLDVPLRTRSGRLVLAGDDVASDVRAVLCGEVQGEDAIKLGVVSFLPTFDPRLGPPFRRWLEQLRERVAARLRELLTTELDLARARGRFQDVGRIARALLEQDPLNERGILCLAESMVLEGSKVEALRILDEYESEVGVVREDLCIAPRTLRRRVAECFDDTLLPRRYEIPFVGRAAEFTELHRAWVEARAGEARCVVLTGEPGIGKTRLASEVLRLAALDGTTTTAYSASAGDSFTPISTLVSVSRTLLALPGALGCSEEYLRYLHRLGTPEEGTVWSLAGMAADIAYAQLVHAFAELVRALTDESPLILFLDDAQRLHQTSWRVLIDIIDRTLDTRFLVVFATRRLPAWFGSICHASSGGRTRHLRLTPFGPDESQHFMASWSDKNQVAVTPEHAAQCVRVSGGNPFYLGELAAHVARDGALHAAPKSIRELIEVQYAAIGKGAQRLLLVIALFEGRATLSRVTQVMDLSSDEFMSALDELEEAGLIMAKAATLRCKHDLVGDTAVGLAMEGVQMFARVRIAELLERESDETNSVELLGDCVTHWERAGEMRRAYQAAMKLGGRLVALGMGTEAEKAYRQARRFTELPAEGIAALDGELVASYLSANWRHVENLIRERQEIVKDSAGTLKSELENDLRGQEASLFALRGLPDSTVLRSVASDRSHGAAIRIRAATVMAMLGDNQFDAELLHAAAKAVHDVDMADAVRPQLVQLHMMYNTILGDFEKAVGYATEMQRVAFESSDYSLRVQGLRRCGAALLRLGDLDHAKHVVLESLSLASRLRLPIQEAACYETLFAVCVANDDVDGARHCASELRSRSEADPQFIGLLSLGLDAELAWILDDPSLVSEVYISARRIELPALHRARLKLHATLIAGAIRLEKAQEVSDELEVALSLFSRGSHFGGQDYPASVLATALQLTRGNEAAGAFQARYLREQRRERAPYAKCLTMFAL